MCITDGKLIGLASGKRERTTKGEIRRAGITRLRFSKFEFVHDKDGTHKMLLAYSPPEMFKYWM